jgi:hypothetical protein
VSGLWAVLGLRREKEITHCSQCEIPYGRFCGRCPVCLGLRYFEIVEPCECGYPSDPETVRKLAEQFAVSKVE